MFQWVYNLPVAVLTALMVALTQSVQPVFFIEMLVVVDNMILGYHWGRFLLQMDYALTIAYLTMDTEVEIHI